MILARSGLPAPTLRGLGDRLAAISTPRRWAAAASAVWVVVIVTYGLGFLGVAAGSVTRGMLFLDAMFLALALVLPVILIWLGAWLAEELQRQREIVAALAELTVPLIGALGATRGALEAHPPVSAEALGAAVQAAVLAARAPDPASQLDRLLAGQARLEVSLQKLAFRAGKGEPGPETFAEPAPVRADPRPPARPAAPQADAPALPLLVEPEPPEGLSWADLVRALDFPRDADDAEGFRALRLALRHHGLAQMLQAAEDVLNLLSQEGVFVDEVPMEPVDPAAWRRFIAGKRGAEVAAVGGIRDEQALGLARGLMKSDTIFRDTSLFFQRRFDSVLGEFAVGSNDAELTELAATRSGRAFMMLARLSGSLD